MLLDREVVSAPTIQTPITGGSGQISGRFTVQQVNDLSVLLRAGALPAKLRILEERAGRRPGRRMPPAAARRPARGPPGAPAWRSARSARAWDATPSRPARWPPTWPP